MRIRTFNLVTWILRIVPAIILLQTLFFKFSAAPESVYIFSTLGLEPVGRIGVGILELVAAILLLMPKTTVIGAALSVVLMSGALWSHLTTLGIVVQDDGGELFILALIVFTSCAALLIIFKRQLLACLHWFDKKSSAEKTLGNE